MKSSHFSVMLKLTKILILYSLLVSPCFADNSFKIKDSVSGFKFTYPISDNKHIVIEGTIAFDITGNEIKSDNVLVRYYENNKLTSTLKADHVVFNKSTKEVSANGNVKIRSAVEALNQIGKEE